MVVINLYQNQWCIWVSCLVFGVGFIVPLVYFLLRGIVYAMSSVLVLGDLQTKGRLNSSQLTKQKTCIKDMYLKSLFIN